MPNRPLICLYGDDFTGTTDSFGQFQRAGLTAALLTRLPTGPQLREVAGSVDVLCVAGLSRSMPVAELDKELRTVFAALAELRPHLIQYKVCSTFDSSKTTGNIGHACEIAIEMFPGRSIAVAPAQPDFGRYTVFGHHFARAADGRVYRLDRHPTMAVHPVTPATESSLRLNLIEQAEHLRVREVHLSELERAKEDAGALLSGTLEESPEVVVFDALTNGDLETVAASIWAGGSQGRPAFCIGSGGISHGIASFLARSGLVSGEITSPTMQPVEAMLAVSGSCSVQTAAQIDQAVSKGWVAMRIDPARFAEDTVAELHESVVASLSAGRSVIVYTASGRPDSQLADVALIGSGLGRIIANAFKRTPVRRLIVAGGDTSGYVMRSLPVTALRPGARVIENAVMCVTTSKEPWFSDVEVMLKGGQVGDLDLFDRVRLGRTS